MLERAKIPMERRRACALGHIFILLGRRDYQESILPRYRHAQGQGHWLSREQHHNKHPNWLSWSPELGSERFHVSDCGP